jgi:hypothetical protein
MSDSQSQMPDWLQKQIHDAMPEIPARDYIYCLQLDFSIDAQLAAISALLHRNEAAGQALAGDIKQVDKYARSVTGRLNDYACDQYVDLCQTSVYQDAAHSMAAVGMLAPLIETIFCQSFQGVRNEFFANCDPANRHARWKTQDDERWDCHRIRQGNRWQTNLVQGIFELSDAVGIRKHWPGDLDSVLTALFAYRNKMFHHGLEWPAAERQAFAKRITDEGWDTKWFCSATSGGDPWVFYLTDEFITHAFETIERVLEGFSTFIKDELLPSRSKP